MFSMKMFALLVILLCASVYGKDYYTVGQRWQKIKDQAPLGTHRKVPVDTINESGNKRAVIAAAQFLLDQRQADYGWSSSVATSRANVALAFVDKIQPLPESEKQLMKKQLNIQLSLDLLQKPMKTSLSHLALYINALYSTCQDPRSFQGLDLVTLLRTETQKNPLNLPIVFLTLCVAGEKDDGDVFLSQLRTIYSSSDRISIKALSLIAWDCMARRKDRKYFEEYSKKLNDFTSETLGLVDGNLDVYSTALYFQASNRANRAVLRMRNTSLLMNHMQADGSFGDLLSTYYAIPALLNTSLIELGCNGPVAEGLTANTFNMYAGGKKVTYSLWIPTDTSVNTRTVTVNYGVKATFYDIMRMAELKDPTYRFMNDTVGGDKKIYSIADAPNDAETGKYWTLYQAKGQIAVNSPKNLHELKSEVNLITPEEGAHYIFWLKHRQVRLP